MKKKLLSMFLAFAMLCAFIPNIAFADIENPFAIEYEFYNYTPAKNAAGEIGDRIKIEEGEKITAGSNILVEVKTKNIQQLTTNGVEMISWDLIYDPTIFTTSVAGKGGMGFSVEGMAIDGEFAENDKYSLEVSDTPYTDAENNSLRRVILVYTANSDDFTPGNEANEVVKEDVTFAFIPFKVADNATAQTKVFTEGDEERCIITTYDSSDLNKGTSTPTTAVSLVGTKMEALTSYTVNVAAVSKKPKVTENTVNKEYYAESEEADATAANKKVGDLKATSTLVISKLDDGSANGIDIPANTVIKLYKATSSTVNDEGKIVLSKGDSDAAIATQTVNADGGSATFTLNDTTNDTATTDYIVTATESGKEESEGVPVVAATATLDIQAADIITAYDKTSAHQFATNSHIRVYGTTDLPIDANTKVYLYEADNETAIADFDISAKATDATYGDYIKVDMAGRDSTKTYYLAAEYADRDVSPVKREVRKQSYEPDAATAEATNNALKASTPDTILIKKIIKEDGTTQDLTASSGIEFKVYESSTTGTAIENVTYADHETEGTFDGVLITLPAGTMTKDGKDLYVEATETNRLPSTRAKIEAQKAGSEIAGLVTIDGTVIGDATATLSDADKKKIAKNTDANPVANPYKIPAGTEAKDFASYGFADNTTNVPVYLTDALEDGTHVAFVTVASWDISSLGDPAALDGDADTNKTVGVTFDTASMLAADVALKDGYTPTVNVTITKNPVIDRAATADEAIEGSNLLPVSPDTITVPAGTTQAQLAEYGLKSEDIAVHFTPAKEDGSSVANIDIDWTYSDLTFPLALAEGDTDSTDYVLTGAFKTADLTVAGVEASDGAYKPEVIIHVVSDTNAKIATGVVDTEYNIVPEPATGATAITGTDKDDIDAKITAETAELFITEIRVPAGTTVAKVKEMLPTKKLPVVVKTTSGGTVTQSIEYITPSWPKTTLPTTDTTELTVTAGNLTEEYTVTGVLNSDELDTAGITLSGVVDLTVKVIVANAPTITLNKGNTNADDITAGRAAEDIFVFRGYTFTDPGLKVTKSDGKELADIASVPVDDLKREYKAVGQGATTPLSAYAASESLGTYFTLDAGVDYSKTYEVTYTYTDPDTKLEATATRMVYVIYKLGDVDRAGSVGHELTTNDYNTMKKHAFNITLLDLTDELFKEKTANVDKTGGITTNDYNTLKKHAFNISLIEQLYSSDDNNFVMTFTP